MAKTSSWYSGHWKRNGTWGGKAEYYWKGPDAETLEWKDKCEKLAQEVEKYKAAAGGEATDMQTEDKEDDKPVAAVDIDRLHNDYQHYKAKCGEGHEITKSIKTSMDNARRERDDNKPIGLSIRDTERNQKKAEQKVAQAEQDLKKQNELLERETQKREEIQKRLQHWKAQKDEADSRMSNLRLQQAATDEDTKTQDAPRPAEVALSTIKDELGGDERFANLKVELEKALETKRNEQQKEEEAAQQQAARSSAEAGGKEQREQPPGQAHGSKRRNEASEHDTEAPNAKDLLRTLREHKKDLVNMLSVEETGEHEEEVLDKILAATHKKARTDMQTG